MPHAHIGRAVGDLHREMGEPCSMTAHWRAVTVPVRARSAARAGWRGRGADNARAGYADDGRDQGEYQQAQQALDDGPGLTGLERPAAPAPQSPACEAGDDAAAPPRMGLNFRRHAGQLDAVNPGIIRDLAA